MPSYGTTRGERATMARSLALLFGTGGALVLATLALPHDANTRDLLVALPALAAFVVAGSLLRFGGALPVGALEAILAGGSLLITLCVLWGGSSASAYPFMYVWVSLWAFYFLRPVAAGAQVGFLGVLLALCFLVQDDTPVPSTHWLMALGTVAVGGALIGRLTQAIREQAADVAAVSQMAAGLSDVSEYAQATCRSLQRSTRADVVILLEPLPDGDGMQVSAMSGAAEAGLVFNGRETLLGLERCYRDAAPLELHGEAGERGARWRGDVVGWGQPVLRDGNAAAVLAVAWTTRRRSISERVRTAALMFAAEASMAMDRAERQRLDRERRALEINDNIVQGLVVAKYSAQRGDGEGSLAAIDETLRRARELITDQLRQVGEKSGGGIRPGDLAREKASQVTTAPRPGGPSPG